MDYRTAERGAHGLRRREQTASPVENRNIRARPGTATVALLSIVCLALGTVPASATVLYSNGPVNGDSHAWTINFGYIVSDNFTLTANSTVTGFDFGAWYFTGDSPETVGWSITSGANGGTTYASGIASLSNGFLFVNPSGYNVGEETAAGLDAALATGTYWLNLQNATTLNGEPLYWDQNSGPSLAFSNSAGSIPSESFAIVGLVQPVPAPLIGRNLPVFLAACGVLFGAEYWGRRKKDRRAARSRSKTNLGHQRAKCGT